MEHASLIPYTTLHGATKLVPRPWLVFRATFYAVILHAVQVLLISTRPTGKFYFPGGGVELGEHLHAALKREVREETGFEIEVGPLLHVEEQFFYHDPTGEAWHALLFFWICTPHLSTTIDAANIDDGEVAGVHWADRQTLRTEEFQHAAHNVVRLIQQT